MIVHLDNLDDPRLAPYRNLKDRALNRAGDRFVAEGRLLVERLLASAVPTESVLVARRVAERLAPLVPPDLPLYVVPDDLLHRIVGFKFHTGALACGRRPTNPSLDDLIGDDPQGRVLLVICPRLIELDNLGSIMRTATALGATGLITGPQCCDPWWRRAIRVSMGTIFSLPIRRSDDIIADLQALQPHRVQRLATVLDPQAEVLRDVPPPRRCAVLLGAEDHGLDPDTLAHCDRRIRIPMHGNADSLNVAIAAALVLHHLMPR